MNLDLTGKHALVCGSTNGIGNSAAILMAKAGCKITAVSRSEDKLQTLVKELNQINGLENGFVQADFSQPESLENALKAFFAKGNTVDILINNTGGPAGGPIHKAETSEFLAAFNQHLICNHILVTNCVESMKESQFGRIINVISTSVKLPLNGLGVSNTIRGAVANWSKTMANELGQYGITVNNVLPGATETGRLKSIIENKAKKTGKTIEEVSNGMKSIIPAARFAQPEEVANAILFLASDKASYINGINIPVDGGRTGCL